MKIGVIMAACLLASGAAYSQAQPGLSQNPSCGESCNSSYQNMGDTTSSADNSHSQATQSNPSSNSNASAAGVTIDPKVQQSGNTVDMSGTTQDTRSQATGGAAIGNQSSNDNRSSVGNTSSASSNNQAGIASVGNTSSTSQGGTGGSVGPVTNTAQGGMGGAGGQGGAASSSTGPVNAGNLKDVGNAKAEQGQGQGQQQGIDKSGNSSNKNANTAVQGQSMDKSGNSASLSAAKGGNQKQGIKDAGNSQQGQGMQNAIDTSDHSVHNTQVDARSLFIPQVAQPVIPSVNPAANITTVTGACGPLFKVNRTVAQGEYLGFFTNEFVALGHDDFKTPYVDSNGVQIMYKAVQMPDGSWQVFGSQPRYFVTVMNMSGSRQLGLGGGGSNMAWGQAAGGGSSAMQRMVTNIQAEDCVAGRIAAPGETRITVQPLVATPVLTKKIKG